MTLLLIFSTSLTIAVVLFVMENLWAQCVQSDVKVCVQTVHPFCCEDFIRPK